MSDREKVIEELKELCEYLFHEYKVCFHGDEEDTYNRFLSANNALELLKEQEAVKPMNGWLCGQCGCRIYQDANYCYNCGRKVKWDG